MIITEIFSRDETETQIHEGAILGVSRGGWDSAAATFGTVFYDEAGQYYPFYVGVSDAYCLKMI